MPSSTELLDAAFRLHQAGALDQAEPLYRQIVTADPACADAWHLLGVVAHQSGRPRDAIDSIGRAIQLNPRSAEYFNHLGAAYGAAGESAEAEASFRAALRLEPQSADIHYNLAAVLATQGKTADAEAAYHTAIGLRSNFPHAHYNLGNLLRESRRYDEAAAQFRRAIELRPNYAEAYTNLGAVLSSLGQVDDAVAALEKSLAIKPGGLKAKVNLGAALTEKRELDAAVAILREATVQGTSAEAHNNLAVALMNQGRLDEAISSINQAIAMAPQYAEAHANRAVIWLFQGNFLEGWKEYEWRFRSKDYAPNPYREPTWDGGPAVGKTILLHAEQGMGDTLQFVRFAPLAKAAGARVLLRCQRLLATLLATTAGVDQIIPDGTANPPFDLQASLMSLPAIVGVTAASAAAGVPYLGADPQVVAKWRERLASDSGFKIGVAWQGNPQYRSDRFRSMPLAAFEPLARVAGATLVSLQRGPGLDQLSAARERFPIVDLGPDVDTSAGAFMDTAAIISQLDLVVTSDSAIAHLAGALGAPVWLALATPCEWRWQWGRADCCWYPSMRIFRQPSLGDWPSVFEEMGAELPKLIAARSN